MSTARTQRRLAAILAADAVGYSRLMGQDEAGTLAALKALRTEVLESKIVEHSGRVFKTTGDGLLAEFPSVVNAVSSAVAIQQAIAEEKEERKIQLRIGINVGDVIVEEGDVFGDGVNVAARIESLAPPGGIALSEMARDHLGSKLKLEIADTGVHFLKNIERPIRVFVIGGPKMNTYKAEPTVNSKPTVAVLPLMNMSGDASQQYFSDGVTEDIITELSRFRSLSVIARNSSFRFRGGDVDVIRVGRELGAQYVLEGSIRKLGNKFRITAQLIDASTGGHIWADRYDRDEQEIFAVQDQVVSTIVATLAGKLEAASVASARRKPPTSLAAYDCVLRADALPFSDPEARAEARRLAERAIQLDPNYSRAYAQLCISYHLEWTHDFSGSNEALEKALSLAERAVMLDDSDTSAVVNLGWVHMQRRSYDLAEYYLTRALELNPNKPNVIIALGVLYGFLGKANESISAFKRAKIIDPHFNPTWYWPQLGITYFIAQNYGDAISHLLRAPTLQDWVHCYLGACYALTNRMEEAARHAQQALGQSPKLTATVFADKEPFKSSSDRDRLLQGLRLAGLPG